MRACVRACVCVCEYQHLCVAYLYVKINLIFVLIVVRSAASIALRMSPKEFPHLNHFNFFMVDLNEVRHIYVFL